ncbi:MAG: molybdopterin molybdotransferase MoeA [Gammaproteobacteria bacterium]|nr:molybdopterin molybdotransferase MoeA [Gammaproteobacteria bacterium]MDH3412773.1 molybdopterin molybdotransferase MoeA [Gammaproteobacteria bacterium]
MNVAQIPKDFCYPDGMISVDQARAFILDRARVVTETEIVDVFASLGRVLAEAHVSPIDVPGYANSAMDGYAVRSADFKQKGEARLEITQRITAGVMGEVIGPGEAARIFTGAPVPEGADAVVMQERCQADGDFVTIPGPIPAGENIRPRGNDILAGREVLPRGIRMRPQEMGLAASVGLAQLSVFRKLKVAIFSTGDELVKPGEPLPTGKIYNSNRYTLTGLLIALGCEILDLGMVEDTLEATQRAFKEAASRADVIVTSGGVSVGEEDHVRAAVEAIGNIELWRVAVKPGKPLAYGRIGEADFLGLPGNPVSTLVTFCLFVRPFLLKRQGGAEVLPKPYPVRAAFEWRKATRRREFARARLLREDGEAPKAEIFPKQGSDVLTSTVWAEGVVEIPEGARVESGDTILFYPFADLLY